MAVDAFGQLVGDLQRELSKAIAGQLSALPGVIIGLLVAVILVIIGWIIGKFLKAVVAKILNAAKLDEWADKHNLKSAVGGVRLSTLAGSFVKWYTVLLFLTVAVDFIKLGPLEKFLTVLVYWLPHLIAGALIVVCGLLLGRFVRHKIAATGFKSKATIGTAAEMTIVIIAVVMGLENVWLEVSLLKSLIIAAFSGFVSFFGIALGIAFGISIGFAHRKEAAAFLAELKKEYGSK